jgi:hypothetical protein
MVPHRTSAGGLVRDSSNNTFLIASVVGLYLIIAAFHLLSAAAGYSCFRDLHLGTALEYAKGNIDILRPVIVGFNAAGTPTPQELPIWQALAGLAFKIFGPWFGWANLLSLVLFVTALWPLYYLAKESIGETGAWWTLLFFLAQPLIFYVSGQASGDGLALSLSIWFLFLALKLVRSGTLIWFAPAVVIGALSAVTKLPFFMAAAITAVFILWSENRQSLRRWILLASAGALCAAAFFTWTYYTDSVIGQAEFPLTDLRVSKNPAMRFWYFGDWHYRLDPANWAKGAWKALNTLFGSFALVGLAAWGAFRYGPRLARWWLASAFIVTLIFSHLVLVHWHYYVFYSPVVALLMAAAVLPIQDMLRMQTSMVKAFASFIAAAALLLSTLQGLIGEEIVWGYDPYWKKIAKVLQEQTTSNDKLVVHDGGWGGQIFFLSHRQGLTMENLPLLDNPEAYRRLKELGYTKIVLLRESPLVTALFRVHPGNAGMEAPTYTKYLTPKIRELPTLFENEDVLIKAMP